MKFLKRYNIYNEGLFSSQIDEQIGENILDIVNKKRDYKPEFENNELVIKNIQLDSNPGTYNVYSTPKTLVLKYFKGGSQHKDIMSPGILQFTKELDCGEHLNGLIYLAIEKAYKRNNI